MSELARLFVKENELNVKLSNLKSKLNMNLIRYDSLMFQIQETEKNVKNLKAELNEITREIDLCNEKFSTEIETLNISPHETNDNNENFTMVSNTLSLEKESSFISNNFSCKKCMLYRRQECIGEIHTCEFFIPSPDISRMEMKNWPEYGTATTYRLQNSRR